MPAFAEGLAKSVFQVHGLGSDGAFVFLRHLWRSQVLAVFEWLEPGLIGIEACAGAHRWARQLTGLGHEVQLMVNRDRGTSGAAQAR